MRKRVLAGLMLLAITIPSQTLAGAGGQSSKAHWDSLSPAQRDRLVQNLTESMLSDVAAGRSKVRVIEGGVEPQGGASISAIGVSGNCRVEWITTPGTGDWVRAVAWTSTTSVVSRVQTSTILLEDGVVRKTAFVSTPNASYANATTAYFFTAWWDTSEWRVRSEHTAINNGVYLWNKVPCTAAATF